MLTTWVPNLEVIDGNDVAGYIEAVGAGVTEFKKGDKAAAMTVSPITGGKWGA
jgi:NADPH:quinone reductase-like Zn-dependent oxidoreductase